MPALRSNNITKARRHGNGDERASNRPALPDVLAIQMRGVPQRRQLDSEIQSTGVSGGGPAQAERGGEAREADLREEAAVDEKDRDRVAVAAGELRIGVHVHLFPLTRMVRENRLDLASHLFAEVAAGAGEQGEPRQGGAGFVATR